MPLFNATEAFENILQYEKFGPKVPGTLEHQKTGDWILEQLNSFHLKTMEQKAEILTHDSKKISIRNIIAQINPEAKKRILLSAHWDTRPFADEDTKNKLKPILGVNDGGSGVVVLIGIAKALATMTSPVPAGYGIDFMFWDAEDLGIPSKPNSYCLGSQYWAKNPIPKNYTALFGINFDMVGRMGSVFPIERYSWEHGQSVITQLHTSARSLNYQDFFSTTLIGPIVDDHYFIREALGFPMIDLIYMDPSGRFAPEWHTHQDTSDFISRDVLNVVAQTTIHLIITTLNESALP